MENFISVQLTKRNIDPITHDFAHQFHLKTLKRGFVSAIKKYIRIPIKILIEYKLSLQLMRMILFLFPSLTLCFSIIASNILSLGSNSLLYI